MTSADMKQAPTWVIQVMMLALLGVSGYFIQNTLQRIEDELAMSRLERAQIRNDMSALEIGLRGDRFTATDWNREQSRIERELDEIRERIAALEGRRGKP